MNSLPLRLALVAASLGCSSRVIVAHAPDAAVGGACGTLSIRQFQAPAAAPACAAARTPAGDPVLRGTLDVALRNTYSLRPLFEWSGAAPVTLRSLTIELHEGAPDGPLIGTAFTVALSTRIAGASAAPGFEVAEVEAIPAPIGDQLKSAVCGIDLTGVTADCPVVGVNDLSRQVLVLVRAEGATDDGCAVTTATSAFPVEACCGCLRRFPVESDRPDTPGSTGPDCNAGTAPGGPASCALGQDFPVDCRLCASTNVAFCQPRGYSPFSVACPR